MLYPSRTLILWFSFITCLGLSCAFFPVLDKLWMILTGITFGIVLIDGLLATKRPNIGFERIIHHNLPVATWSKVTIKIRSHENMALFFEFHDLCPPLFQTKHYPNSLHLPPNQYATTQYKVFPTKRGNFSFNGANIFITSPLSLWQKKWSFPYEDEVKVFPNFKEIGHYELLATHHHLSQMGIKKLTRRGEGTEFHQLREYRQGDDLQKIDWKATSRYRKLISKEYQDERDQQIIFLLDCGQTMGHVEDGRRHIDQALNSILLLGYVASRQGDSVGLYSFGGDEKWLPPKKQHDGVRSLLLGLYDIESTDKTADYLRATREILSLQERRSLMIIITNSRTENYQDLISMGSQLSQKHLVIIADLKEKTLDETTTKPIHGFTEASRYLVLQHYLIRRKTMLKQLQHRGIQTLDITADQLPGSLVNRYLEIKSTGRL